MWLFSRFSILLFFYLIKFLVSESAFCMESADAVVEITKSVDKISGINSPFFIALSSIFTVLAPNSSIQNWLTTFASSPYTSSGNHSTSSVNTLYICVNRMLNRQKVMTVKIPHLVGFV